MSWGWAGEYQFQEKTCVYFSKFVESCIKLSQELQSYYGKSGSMCTLWNKKGKKNEFQYVTLGIGFRSLD